MTGEIRQVQQSPHDRAPAGLHGERQAEAERQITTLFEHVDGRTVDEGGMAQINEDVLAPFLQPDDGVAEVVDRSDVVVAAQQHDSYLILHSHPDLGITLDQCRSVQTATLL